MKKQKLFRADGGPQTVSLLPRNLEALRLANVLGYVSWNRADRGTTFSYAGRQCYKTTFTCPSAESAKAAFGLIQNSLGGGVVRGYSHSGGNLHIYSSTDSSYTLVRSMVEAMQKLYSLVGNLPESTSEDQYRETNGQTVTVAVPNTTIELAYTVPFDMTDWELRHKTAAQVAASDAGAKQKQEEANLAEAEAKKEASKARLLRVGSVAATVAVLALVVFLVVKIVKK